MRRQITAAALSLALCGSLLPATALAVEKPGAATDAALAAAGAADNQPLPQKELYPADPEGTVSFKNLEARVRAHNANLLVLEETIASIQVLDYDEMYEDLRENMNNLADMQWGMIVGSQTMNPITGKPFVEYDSYAYAQMDQAYDAMRDTFDDIKEGKLQKDNADIVRQLREAQNQVVMGAESLYVALAGLEIQESSLARQLTALDRTVTEMELRYQLGQISALQLQQVKNGRISMASGLETLRTNIKTLKMQLEQMIGAELTGTIRLVDLPQVRDSQLAKLDVEADLAAAKEKSYSLYDAKKTLDEAQEDYKDAAREYDYDEKDYQFLSARHTWQAAQHTYNANVQSFDLRFRTTYLQLLNYQQALDAAKASLDYENSSCAAAELKYQQGAISKNALLDARDKVSAAQETVRSASIDLFSAYHTYQWAVEYGILN